MASPASPLTAATPRTRTNTGQQKTLTVYIEGDGLAWQTRSEPSSDPTPIHPVGLRLALSHAGDSPVAYLSRPCQYESRKLAGCEHSLWTSKRYGPENLKALSLALNQLKADDQTLLLIGYSGGGVMAILLAATRSDVRGVITIAANLDTTAWTKHHQVSPLTGSIDPLSFREELAITPQVHLIGSNDDIVPTSITSSYLEAIGLKFSRHVITRSSFDHRCCWVDDWPSAQLQAFDLLEAQSPQLNEGR